MISSKGSVVVGDQGPGGAGLLGGLVVPDGCCAGEESLQYARGDAGAGAAAVAFEAELGFEGPVDRFDDLAQRAQEPPPGPGRLCFGGGADERDAGGVELVLEPGSPVALVGDEGQAPPGDPGVGDHVQTGVALVGFGPGERVGHRQPRRRCDEVQAQAPEPSRVRGAVAVGGPSGEVRAPLGLAAAAALHRGRVHDPDVVVKRRAVPGQRADHVFHQLTAAAQALVVAGPLRHEQEPRVKVRCGVADEAGLGVEPQQRLQHRQGDQLRVRQPRRYPHRRPLRRPFGMRRQQVIDPHIQCSHEGVQVRVHTKVLQDRGLWITPSLDTLTPHMVDPTPWNYSSR